MSETNPSVSSPQRILRRDGRKQIVKLRLSDPEARRLEELARASGISRQLVLRKLLFSCPVLKKPEPQLMELLRAVERLETDLNMIAWSVSSPEQEKDPNLKEAVRIMREIRNETERWKARWL